MVTIHGLFYEILVGLEYGQNKRRKKMNEGHAPAHVDTQFCILTLIGIKQK